MAFRHLRDVLGEAGAMSFYIASSVMGALVKPKPHHDGHRQPVVLVPGFLGRGLGFFRLKSVLAKQGYPVYVADMGFGIGCIEEKSSQLEKFIDDHDLDDFFLIGHSMGGLVAMGMSAKTRNRVRHFITLGTAYHGAVLSYLLPVFPAARQLNPKSPLLTRLLKRVRDHENLTMIVARWDEIALPPRSCRVEGCDARTGIAGHVQLIMRSSSFDQLLCLLEELDE